jgi:hypothetical protein
VTAIAFSPDGQLRPDGQALGYCKRPTPPHPSPP